MVVLRLRESPYPSIGAAIGQVSGEVASIVQLDGDITRDRALQAAIEEALLKPKAPSLQTVTSYYHCVTSCCETDMFFSRLRPILSSYLATTRYTYTHNANYRKYSMNTMTTIIVIATAAAAIGFGAKAYAQRGGGHHGDKMISRITDRLNLDDSQAEALKALQNEIIETRTLIKGDSSNMKERLSQMINAESFDQGAALTLINERAEAFQANAPELVATAGTFFDSLNVEQKAQVQKFMDKNGKRFKRHRGQKSE